MADVELDSRFKFVPYAEQPDQLTWDEKLAHPKTHNILFEVDFSNLPPFRLRGKKRFCQHCQQPYQRIIKDYERGWGDISRLNCIVPQTPQIECKCRLFAQFEPYVGWRLTRFFRTTDLIRQVFEFEEDEDKEALKRLLKEDDYKKVIEFSDVITNDPLFREGQARLSLVNINWAVDGAITINLDRFPTGDIKSNTDDFGPPF